MGGWVMLLAALARPERVAGMIGIAAAPDFTDEMMAATLSAEQRGDFERQGYFCRDKDSAPGKPVFNRTVGLRDTWARVAASG